MPPQITEKVSVVDLDSSNPDTDTDTDPDPAYQMNPGPVMATDPDPIRIQGFDDKKWRKKNTAEIFEKLYFLTFFLF
jgi:hypothetical protein